MIDTQAIFSTHANLEPGNDTYDDSLILGQQSTADTVLLFISSLQFSRPQKDSMAIDFYEINV